MVQTAVTERRCHTISSQLAQALVHIHAQGFVHAAVTFAMFWHYTTPIANGHPILRLSYWPIVGLANYVRHYGEPRTLTTSCDRSTRTIKTSRLAGERPVRSGNALLFLADWHARHL